jgi:hypothetical protein
MPRAKSRFDKRKIGRAPPKSVFEAKKYPSKLRRIPHSAMDKFAFDIISARNRRDVIIITAERFGSG